MPSSRRRLGTLVAVLVLCLAGAAAAIALGGGDGSDPARPGTEGTAPPGTTGATSASTTATTRGPLGSGQAVTLAFAGDMHFEGVVAGSVARRTRPTPPSAPR